MLLIPDNTTLRQFIPNTFSQTYPDQETIYDKMLPHLTAAELWLTERLVPHDILHRIVEQAQSPEDPLYFVPRSIVALKAWADAIPSLDIVVSDNGISTVETNTLRPASKAKIDRLIETTRRQLDQTLRLLPALLAQIPEWWHTGQAEPFRRTTFSDYTILDQIPNKIFEKDVSFSEHTIHEKFLAALPAIIETEQEIAQYWISAPVMDSLRKLSTSEKSSPSPEGRAGVGLLLLEMVRTAIVAILGGADPIRKKKILRRLADFVVTHPEDFPQWRGTSTAALFSVPTYKNRQNATAHWL